ncbi:hypothetical protein BG005_000737 [Podila minutissima]|nr:hypothetical protein BG005_000737 [Podila minutissima]
MDAVDMNMFVSHFATIQQDQVFTRIASTSFSLDVVSPSRQSFERYQGILRVSEFEHLHVVCTPFDLDLCDAFAQMLHSISWFTLKTLSIIGDNIDGWMQHLPSVVDAPRLMSVSIHGTDSEASQLSHASVLNVQRLIQANPRTELKFENVKLQDTCDWVFIVERMDLSLLNADDLPECCESHLVSTSYAVDLFI